MHVVNTLSWKSRLIADKSGNVSARRVRHKLQLIYCLKPYILPAANAKAQQCPTLAMLLHAHHHKITGPLCDNLGVLATA